MKRKYNFVLALKISFVLLLVFYMNVPGFCQTVTREFLINKYNSIDNSINRGGGYGNYNNEKGTLAWGESYILESYLDMYSATKDSYYLNKFVTQADLVVKNADIVRGEKDYRGQSVTGWRSTYYSKNKEPMVWAVHSGMITYPLAKFTTVLKGEDLNRYKQKSREYTKIAQAAVKVFDRNWMYDGVKREGVYTQDDDAPVATPSGTPLPFNMQLALGRTLLVLHKTTGDEEYLNKVSALARHFKHNLSITPNGAYTWQYWYGKGLNVTKAVEDISHGGIDLDFALMAQKENIVFDSNDIHKFVNTYKNISRNHKYSHYVDGTVPDDKMKGAISSWLELSPFDCDVWNDYLSIVDDNKNIANDASMLGISKLIKFYEVCVPK